jgi:hypothetical protein
MSIPANIAEGRRQKSEKEFSRFLGYALNSSSELEYHLIVVRDTKIIAEADFVSLVSQTITVRKDAARIAQATLESRTRSETAENRFAVRLAARSRPAHRPRQVVFSQQFPGK